jgi:hypothetical protein
MERDRGLKLSKKMIALFNAWESWDTQQFMSSGHQEWREFYRAFESAWEEVKREDSRI